MGLEAPGNRRYARYAVLTSYASTFQLGLREPATCSRWSSALTPSPPF